MTVSSTYDSHHVVIPAPPGIWYVGKDNPDGTSWHGRLLALDVEPDSETPAFVIANGHPTWLHPSEYDHLCDEADGCPMDQP